MNIMLISPLGDSVGGISTWTKNYLDYCKSNNLKINLIDTSNNRKKTIVKTMIHAITSTIEFRKQLIRNKVSIVHINSPCSYFSLLRDLIYVLIAKLHKVPVIIHYHCDVKFMVNSILKKIIFVISVINSSSAIVLDSSSYNFVKKYKQECIKLPNFLLSDSLQIPSHQDKITKNVLFVGRISRMKGYDIINHLADNNQNTIFNIIGSIEEQDLVIKKENIMIHGKKENSEVIEFMKKSNALILPSRTEGFPMVILEAMSLGLPIFASNVGAISEMLSDPNNCVFDIKTNYDYVNKKFQSFLNQDMTILSNNNFKKFCNEYTDNIVMSKLIKLYEKLME